MDYRTQEFQSDEEDPTGSWDAYLKEKQGSVGLAFPGKDFNSSALSQSFGRLQVVKFSTGALDYRRMPSHIRADDGEESYRILVPLEGHFRFEQGDAREIFYPGKVGFFRWHDPLFMTHDQGITALILTVPEGSFDNKLAADAPLALDEKRPLVRSLQAQVRLLGEPHGWTGVEWSVAYGCAVEALKGVLNPYPDAKLDKGASDADRVRRLIEDHAKNPDVTPADIAAMLGIAERTLYRVLDRAGYPPAGVILRDIRTERVHRRVRTAQPFDVHKVAREEGFPNARSLRAAYQERYGRTPAQAREQLFGDNAGT